jgi:hypothetical protein
MPASLSEGSVVLIAGRFGEGGLPNRRRSLGLRRLEHRGVILESNLTLILEPCLVLGFDAVQFGAQLQGALPRHHQSGRAIKSRGSGRSGVALFGRLARHGQRAHVSPSFRGTIGTVPRNALTEKSLLGMIAGAEGVSILFHVAPLSGHVALPLNTLH